MIEKMFEELDSTERLEASLILTRGIKPDTPLDKAPIILSKVFGTYRARNTLRFNCMVKYH